MSDDRFTISRRTVLAGLGTVGLASAGAGFGTTAYFNDTESFTDNTLTAGELNLVVNYHTGVDQGSATGTTESVTGSGTVDGDNEYSYDINDVKPGDSGYLVFCPKIIDNPAYLWVGSSGVTDFENGSPEPELEVDGTNGDPGEGEGELSESILVTVSYGSESEEAPGYTIDRTLGNPEGYTLADLADDLSEGFLIEPNTEDPVYPASADGETQTGPCIIVEWLVPTSVGNEIQTDGLSMDFVFAAEQARHNDDPSSPFASTPQ